MYTCKKCEYTTSRRDVYQRHLKRKRPCVSKIKNAKNVNPDSQNISPDGIKNSQNISPDSQNISPDSQNISPDSQNISPDSQNVSLACSGCERIYSNVYNLHRHKCTETPSLTCPHCLRQFKHYSSKYNHLKRNKCIQVESSDSEGEKSEKKNEKPSTINNATNNTTATTANTHNGSGNIINLHIHGQEDTSHISLDIIKRLLEKCPYPKFIAELFNLKYIEKPENRTMKITNSRGEFLLIHSGDDKWKFAPQNEVFNPILDNLNKYTGIVIDKENNLSYNQKKHYKDNVQGVKDDKPKNLRKKICHNFKSQLLNVRDEEAKTKEEEEKEIMNLLVF